MKCYRCESESLELSPLWPRMAKVFVVAEIVLRTCQDCGLKQNHYGGEETLTPVQAAELAPKARDGVDN